MKKTLFAAILLAGTVLTGCGSGETLLAERREIENLQLVETLGYDRTEKGRVRLSASSGPESEELENVRVIAEGRSIPDALRALRRHAARGSLFFSHVQCIAVGERAAREGIGELLDWAERDGGVRLDLPLFVVRGGDASELITGSDDEQYEISAELLALQKGVEEDGSSYAYTLADVAERLARSGCALCCCVCASETEEFAPSSEGGITALPCGFAILSDGKLTGYADERASRGICLLTEHAGNGNMTLAVGEDSVSLTLGKCESRLRAHYDAEGKPWLEAEVHCRAAVSESPDTPLSTETDAVDAAFTEELHACVRAALGVLRAGGVDFLELERLFARADPVRRRGIDWAAELPHLRCSIRVSGTTERSFDIRDGVSTDGGGAEDV